jgi:hypothetical protein
MKSLFKFVIAFLALSSFHLTDLAGVAQAAIITATIKGTIYSGYDNGSNGRGYFGAEGSLNGKPYSLVFTFDDSKGQKFFGPDAEIPDRMDLRRRGEIIESNGVWGFPTGPGDIITPE